MSSSERYNSTDSEFSARLEKLVEYATVSNRIDLNLYTIYDVKRGLRDSNGKGVLTGLTEISDVVAFNLENGKKIACDGRLYYQGYNVQDLTHGFKFNRYAFEETTYLLLFGELPTEEQMTEFIELMGHYRSLPDSFVRDIIMKAPSKNIMNSLQKSVLTLYTYDQNPDDISIPNITKQSLQLIAQFPLISVYAYQAYRHYHLDDSLVIRNPKADLSAAENILHLLRQDGKYTELEARVLDVCLVLHAEHGGGNNSTFTTNVVSSSGTDTYSAVTASLGSLKGPKHGGANLKVQQMFDDLKIHVLDWEDEQQIRNYIQSLINKEGFDKSGLVYGVGHAVYTKSDPRCVILKKYAKALSEEKGRQAEFNLYATVERIACEMLAAQKNLHKDICANVDFYSGFVYNMLDLPCELYTPLFAMSRISGWCAHRIEELVNSSKIIRPAYKYVGHHRAYVPLDARKVFR